MTDGAEVPIDETQDEQPRLTNVSRAEIVIGLVGALGTDLELVERTLRQALLRVSYKTATVRVSEEIGVAFETAELTLASTPPTKLDELMDKGDQLRALAGDGGVTAALAISAISSERQRELGDSGALEREATATIIRQLKHPDEVQVLRTAYGPRFVLLGAWAPLDDRQRATRARLQATHPGKEAHWYAEHVERLVRRDEKDGVRKLGQRVRDTFELADAYVALLPGKPIDATIERLVDLLFGSPFGTPTRDEQAMYQAAGARLRSSASGRQVGVVVVDGDGEVLVTGTNDVPKPMGGQYWANETPDFRDFQYGFDYNDRQKIAIMSDIVRRLQDAGWLDEARTGSEPERLAAEVTAEDGPLGESRVGDLLEFGRILHAEMAAISTSARRGTPIGGQTMYSTTYPCHQCARLIIGSGIRKVVYIDPYPKSLVPDMYRDEVVHGPSGDATKVVLEPFQGVAPRLYRLVFAMSGRDRDPATGDYEPWDADVAVPKRLASADAVYPIQYMEDHFTEKLEDWLRGNA